MTEEANEFLPTRHSLLARLKDWEDQASWREFFDTYWQLIYAVARKAGLSDAEAQDTVQETVLTVAKKVGDFKAQPNRLPCSQRVPPVPQPSSASPTRRVSTWTRAGKSSGRKV